MRFKVSHQVLLTSLLVLTATAASADPHHRGAEKRNGRGPAKVEAREYRDDLQDLRRLRELRRDFERARDRGSRKALRRVDRKLEKFLKSELREARRELEIAVREARFSRYELRGERHRGATRRGLRDERRDLRIDRHDVRVQRQQLDELRQLRRQFRRVAGDFDRRSLHRKDVILRKLTQLARAELGHATIEWHGGRREGRRRG